MAAAIGIAKTATEIFLGVGTVSVDNLTFQVDFRSKQKPKLFSYFYSIEIAKLYICNKLAYLDFYLNRKSTFQLHYRWSVTLFTVCSVLVQTSQFFGDPVQCETVSTVAQSPSYNFLYMTTHIQERACLPAAGLLLLYVAEAVLYMSLHIEKFVTRRLGSQNSRLIAV